MRHFKVLIDGKAWIVLLLSSVQFLMMGLIFRILPMVSEYCGMTFKKHLHIYKRMKRKNLTLKFAKIKDFV